MSSNVRKVRGWGRTRACSIRYALALMLGAVGDHPGVLSRNSASYWVVVPDVDQPELIAFELRDGRYEQVAHVTGGKPFRAERPFPVEVIPASLVADLLPN